jgi:hypothetical protein
MLDRLKELGPEAALRWLLRPDVIHHLGAKQAASLRKRYQAIMDNARLNGCSAARIDSHIAGGEPVHAPGMVRGLGSVRYGDGPPRERWTPPQAVALEDRYDTMTAIEAALCNDPSSVTGRQFQELEMRNNRVKRRAIRAVPRAKAVRIRQAQPANSQA